MAIDLTQHVLSQERTTKLASDSSVFLFQDIDLSVTFCGFRIFTLLMHPSRSGFKRHICFVVARSVYFVFSSSLNA